jgi:deoxyribodipyrimidine photo-lyase
VTWRELGYNFACRRPEHEAWESLPAWARRTLDAHAADPRPELYELEELEAAATADPLWNAAQRQLRREGAMHGYLRMLWGKKILEWSPSPRQALERMIHLNNKWALDGRDPNSYSGILWCLGRHDRPWAPERAVFGSVRYMSSANTARKMNVKGYLERYAASPATLLDQAFSPE